MSLTGIPEDRVRYQRTFAGVCENRPYFMNTIIIGDVDSSKPKLVLTHGFGSSAPILYKLFATLE